MGHLEREVVAQGLVVGSECLQVRGVGQEGGQHQLRDLEADEAQLLGNLGASPQPLEPFPGLGRGVPRAHEHPVPAHAPPQRAVGEDVAEGLDHVAAVGSPQEAHREPVGRDAALGEPLAHESEVLLGVEVHDAGDAQRGRLSGDHVVAAIADQEIEARVLDEEFRSRGSFGG